MKPKVVAIGASVLVIAAIIGGYMMLNSNQSTGDDAATSGTPTPAASSDPNAKLETSDEVVGTGAEAVAGKKATVNYTGKLTNGKTFDSNTDPSFNHVQPFSFTLGAGEVIKGWDEGVAGMKVGGKRKLTIPPSMGYGAQGQGSIPANSTLVFEVELLDVK